MPRALILSLQPPGCSGVQARRYGKLLPHMAAAGWEFHFVGPDPSLDSVLPEVVPDQQRFCHYSRQVSLSQVCAIRKNRRRRGSPLHGWFALRQLVHRLLERLLNHDSLEHTISGITQTALTTAARLDFDMVAGICPDFRVLEAARRVADQLQQPFIAIYDDPFGHREVGAFHPAEPARQRALLTAARGAIFASPLTLRRYWDQGLLGNTPSAFLPDCFDALQYALSTDHAGASRAAPGGSGSAALKVFHPGSLGPWRPIEALLQAVRVYSQEPQRPIVLYLYGYLYEQARRAIGADEVLRTCVELHAPVSNEQSHRHAERADVLLVLIGPRHTDNLPSKFFEYLCHPTPILVAGPSGSPLEDILSTLQKGIYCDINDSDSIYHGLMEITANSDQYRRQHHRNREAIAAYSSKALARRWGETFDRFLLQEAADAQTKGG
jgi:glycosyltransferase involved in cell wall biosynthesis